MPIYGNPCNMEDILSICKKHNLMLIEDCCESMGAKYKDKYVGSFGRVASFSFYFSHHITTLEGGICVTNDHDLSEMMRIVRAHGWVRQVENRSKWTEKYKNFDPKFLFVNDGYNLRITEPQASMGLIQIDKIDELSQYKSELNSEIDKMIENKESGMILLKLVEIIGEKELNELNSESLNFIIEVMNRTKLISLRNELLLEILPLKV